jgi:hypothetical protein
MEFKVNDRVVWHGAYGIVAEKKEGAYIVIFDSLQKIKLVYASELAPADDEDLSRWDGEGGQHG